MIGAARWAATTASLELLRGDEPIDAEEWSGDAFPLADMDWFLSQLAAVQPFSDADHAMHLGQPQIPADRATHAIIAEYLRVHRPSAVVVGEEANASEWGLVDLADVGTEVFVVDAIDGSGPFEDLTFGYGATITSLTKIGEHAFKYNGALTSNSSGYYLVQQRLDVFVGNALTQGTNQEPLQLGAPLRSDTSNSIAVVAARAEHRSFLDAVVGWDVEQSFKIYTMGGAPASIGMAIGRLDAIACPRPQSTWDAAYLPALVALGCHVYMVDGGVADLALVTHWLEQLNAHAKTVPPFIVTSNGFDLDDALSLLNAEH